MCHLCIYKAVLFIKVGLKWYTDEVKSFCDQRAEAKTGRVLQQQHDKSENDGGDGAEADGS